MHPRRMPGLTTVEIQRRFGDIVLRIDVLVSSRRIRFTLPGLVVTQPYIDDDHLRESSWPVAAAILHARLDKWQHIFDAEDRVAYDRIGKMLADSGVHYQHR